MNRREFLAFAAACAAGAVSPRFFAAAAADVAPDPWTWDTVSLVDIRSALRAGTISAENVVRHCLHRIATIDRAGPALNSVIELNPDAVAVAAARAYDATATAAPLPRQGLPILVKDNLDTHDKMQTTAGSNALQGSVALRDSTVVRKLRDAGAVLLGKTNLSEWANFRGARSTSGWSARGGLTRNPYALDRNPSGSSSGSAVAVAAGLCAAAVGTETNGSILSPSAVCGVVGVKPTVGLVSRAGIIPISASQDTAGPMARTVTDAAVLLSAIAGPDDRDPATAAAEKHAQADYAKFLEGPGALKGARLGVYRPGFPSVGSVTHAAYQAALDALRDGGATLVDLAALGRFNQLGDASYQVMLYEFKAGLNDYLAGLSDSVKVRSLADVIRFNEAHRDTELRHFGQEILIRANDKRPLTDPAYVAALEKCRRVSRAEGIDAVMAEHKLDAIVAPSGGPAAVTDLVHGDRGVGGTSGPAAVAGYPNVTVPAGDVRGLPVGLSFFGRAWSEPLLLRLAHAFEQLTRLRKPPSYLPTVG
jgi:amidase